MPATVTFLQQPAKAVVIAVRLEVWLPSRLKNPPPAAEKEPFMPAPLTFLEKPVKALVIVTRLEVWLPSRLKGGVIPDPPPVVEGNWLLTEGVWDDQGFWDDAGTWNDGVGGTLPDAPVNTVLPVVTGSLTQGSTLSCSTGSWTNSPTSYAYQWLNAGSPISGATASTYATVVGDVGDLISCRVTASNAGGSSSPATSAAVGPIEVVLTVPVNTALPVVTGSLTQGSTLSCSTGSWTNSPTSYAYQWLNAGSPISGATASTYATVVGDVGDMISCRVTASNAAGASSPATSAAVGPIEAQSVDASRFTDGTIYSDGTGFDTGTLSGTLYDDGINPPFDDGLYWTDD